MNLKTSSPDILVWKEKTLSSIKYEEIVCAFLAHTTGITVSLRNHLLKGNINHTSAYHHIHLIQQYAENAITMIENLKDEPDKQSNPQGAHHAQDSAP